MAQYQGIRVASSVVYVNHFPSPMFKHHYRVKASDARDVNIGRLAGSICNTVVGCQDIVYLMSYVSRMCTAQVSDIARNLHMNVVENMRQTKL